MLSPKIPNSRTPLRQEFIPVRFGNEGGGGVGCLGRLCRGKRTEYEELGNSEADNPLVNRRCELIRQTIQRSPLCCVSFTGLFVAALYTAIILTYLIYLAHSEAGLHHFAGVLGYDEQYCHPNRTHPPLPINNSTDPEYLD